MGDKVIEVRQAGVNKLLGDDITDEDMFRMLPNKAITIKVGLVNSYARYNLPSYKDAISFLNYLVG